jgi:predicted  nucleic acid-binding Zn ribbon protein
MNRFIPAEIMQLVEVQLTNIAIVGVASPTENRADPKLGELDDNELIDILVGCWRHNGQVLGREHPTALTVDMPTENRTYRLFLMIPSVDALDSKYDCGYVRSAKEKLVAAGFELPQIKIYGFNPSTEPCKCNRHSYILYTNYVRLESCLCCGDCFQPVPLYRIPWQPSTSTKGELHDRIMCWQSNYQSCDRLQMNCVVGERFALKEMSRHDSTLSKQGIEICRDITSILNTPTYYYLYRYRGRSQAKELQRLCPSCGGEWLLSAPFHRFDFKCDRCLLVSNIAMSLPEN